MSPGIFLTSSRRSTTNAGSIRRSAILAGFGYAAIVLFSMILFYTAWETVTFSYSFQAYSNGALELPMWIAQSPMLAGAALLGFMATVRLCGVAMGDRRR